MAIDGDDSIFVRPDGEMTLDETNDRLRIELGQLDALDLDGRAVRVVDRLLGHDHAHRDALDRALHQFGPPSMSARVSSTTERLPSRTVVIRRRSRSRKRPTCLYRSGLGQACPASDRHSRRASRRSSVRPVERHPAAVVADDHPLLLRVDNNIDVRRRARVDVLKPVRDVLPGDELLVREEVRRLQEVARRVGDDAQEPASVAIVVLLDQCRRALDHRAELGVVAVSVRDRGDPATSCFAAHVRVDPEERLGVALSNGIVAAVTTFA